jgi:hypothetical protein
MTKKMVNADVEIFNNGNDFAESTLSMKQG